MSKVYLGISGELRRQILGFSKHIAGSAQISAIGLLDNGPLEDSSTRATLEVVLVVRDFQPRLLSYVKVVDGRNIMVFAVDQWVFERDVERGFLGEALASMLILPYRSLSGGNYLHAQEIMLKKRLIIEVLMNLVFSFPELSRDIRVKPQYFVYETILDRVRVFPPLSYGVLSCLYGESSEKEIDSILRGYMEALRQLETEGKIVLSGGFVIIPEKLVAEGKNPKVRLTSISKNAPRALFGSLFGAFPQMLNFLSQNMEAFLKSMKSDRKEEAALSRRLVDPQKFVYVPTSVGLVSLVDRVDITSFARHMFLKNKDANVKVERVGGVLNDVYLIESRSNGAEKKVLVKRFKEWSGFKWFPLTLWSIGTRTFAVLGRYRLERECAISELLRREGFNVPKILHVSNNERLVFMEYVEGENFANAMKRISISRGRAEVAKELADLAKVGETFAKVHLLGVTLGDAKPENVIVNANGAIYLLDFEQASHGGDKSWDIAEFLYYSGHYLQPLNNGDKAGSIARTFIGGYLGAGGNVDAIKKAGTAKYTRVFSVFTLPAVILAMSNVCKETEALR